MNDQTSPLTTLASETTPDAQPLADRGENRSQRPSSPAFRDFITSSWAPRAASTVDPSPAAEYTAARRAALSDAFPGDRLIIPAGTLKQRSNDTDYRFRPHSAFAHLTGLGTDQEPDAVLVLEPSAAGGPAPGRDLGPRAPRGTAALYPAPPGGGCRPPARRPRPPAWFRYQAS